MGDDIESDKLDQGIRDSIIKMIKKREEKRMMGEPDSYGSDFLGLLLKAYHSNDKSKKISVDDLIDECKTFYVAGQETSSSSLTWTVLLLAIHTDWQDKAREEVLQLFGQQNPSPDSIGRLKTVSKPQWQNKHINCAKMCYVCSIFTCLLSKFSAFSL